MSSIDDLIDDIQNKAEDIKDCFIPTNNINTSMNRFCELMPGFIDMLVELTVKDHDSGGVDHV